MTHCDQILSVARWWRFRRFALVAVAGLCGVLSARSASAQLFQIPTAIQDARLVTMDGRTFLNATLLIKGEKIVALGPGVKIPLLALRLNAKGGTITPGLIDISSVLGRSGSNSGSAGTTRRAEDAFDRYDTANLTEALRNGVTALWVSPTGPAGFCGTGAIVRLVQDPKTKGALGKTLKTGSALCINLGEDTKPITRLKTLASIRKQFRAAVDHRRAMEDYAEDLTEYKKKLEDAAKKQDKKKPAAPEKPSDKKPQDDSAKKEKKEGTANAGKDEKPKKPPRPKRDPSAEILLRAIDRELPVRMVAHSSADIVNALELAEEFGFELILEDATEAHLVADQIADAEVPVILSRMDDAMTRNTSPTHRAAKQQGASLGQAGVAWTLGSGTTGANRTRFLAFNAQLAAANDPQKDPLRLVTAEAADLLRVGDQIGRLRPGMLADFVLWSGDPLDPASRILRVYVGGTQVYDATARPNKGIAP